MLQTKKRYAIAIFIILSYTATVAIIASLWLVEPQTQNAEWAKTRLLAVLLFLPILLKYIIHNAIAPWYPRVTSRAHKKRSQSYQPRVSVIIPAWNEEVGIVNTITSILNNSYSHIELIVVNDGSTDNTDNVIKTFIATKTDRGTWGEKTITYIHKANGGKSSALNRGLAIAGGEIIITTDADSFVDSQAIANIVKHFQNPAVVAVAGNVKIGNRNHLLGLIQQVEYLYGFYFKQADSLLNAVYIVGGAAAAYRREIFNQIGIFDEEIITEDIEYSTRIHSAGYKIAYAADALFYTEGPANFSDIIKQRLRWKYGRLTTFSKYRHLFFSLRSHHSKFLTCFILPMALFAETLLFFEVLLLGILFSYSFITGDFTALVISILILTAITAYQIVTDARRRDHLNLLWITPIAWIIFYIIDFIEYIALMKSLHRIIRKREVAWQKWKRVGVFSE